MKEKQKTGELIGLTTPLESIDTTHRQRRLKKKNCSRDLCFKKVSHTRFSQVYFSVWNSYPKKSHRGSVKFIIVKRPLLLKPPRGLSEMREVTDDLTTQSVHDSNVWTTESSENVSSLFPLSLTRSI